MKKINNYFPHDFNARNDIKLKKLNMQVGLAGIGLYWCIVEFLYENNGYLTLDDDLELLAYELRIDKKTIIDLIENSDLFKIKNNKFYSPAVLSRLEDINKKSNINRKNSLKRWGKTDNAVGMRPDTDGNATAMQPECNIKEKKIKENKIKNKNNITTTTTNNIYSFIEENFSRTLSGIEYEKITKWLSEFNNEIIESAVTIAVMNQKKTFAYVDGILKNWKAAGYKTLEDIQSHDLKNQNYLLDIDPDILEYNWLTEKGVDKNVCSK